MNNDQLAVATIKGLAMDAVEQAGSGHPGMPMGMADLATVLWGQFLVVNPDQPDWIDRDRFVLSNGHGSMLLFALLHLSGFPISLDDIRNFRQWGSPTPGHPEIDHQRGVEVTTGPLGQGFGMGVGLALAETKLADRFGSELIDHRTFGFVSDGDLMEGISAESSSLAGHWGLGKLIYFYDHNQITIDGSTDITFTEDVASRFGAVGWHTIEIDGHDHQAIAQATQSALDQTEQPSLVIAHTHIAAGAPHAQDTAAAHGAPLGPKEVTAAKANLGIPPEEQFWVPLGAVDFFSSAMDRGRAAFAEWNQRREQAWSEDAGLKQAWEDYFHPKPADLSTKVSFAVGERMATRAAGGKLFEPLSQSFPGLVGGAADLVGSTKTHFTDQGYFSVTDRSSANIAFGIREHAMAAIVNGVGCHGGLRAYGATFLVFSDYMRPSIRLSALMEVPSIWVFTHDSIWLGEDGPTHQPVEHIASLRLIPNLWVIRPADAHETVASWELALDRTEGPTAILCSRQGLAVLPPDLAGTKRGGYIVGDQPAGGEQLVLIGTGSEVHTCLEASQQLASRGVSVRVVSMPCLELFRQQSCEYQRSVLGDNLPKISVEAGVTSGWERLVGDTGRSIGIDRFGASAPGEVVATQLGITPIAVVEQAIDLLGNSAE